MHRSPEWYEQIREVESIVRSAADYVQASKDLRPRVLEKARLGNSERRARRYIRYVGLIAAMVTWFITAGVDRLETDANLRRLTLIASGPCSISAHSSDTDEEHAAWTLVDEYTALRVRQAAVLRLSL